MKNRLHWSGTSGSPTRDPKAYNSQRFSRSLPRPTLAPSASREFVSPVPHLLHSNAPPSDSERVSIQNAIDCVSNEISGTSNANSASKVDPKLAGRRYDAGVKFIQTHKDILSPLRLLPLEILAEIICIFCESYFWEPHPHSITFAPRSIARLPWAASQVSQLWRSAALSLHHVWGQLFIDACFWETPKPSKSFLSLFNTLIDRSHEAPLCIHFCTGTPSHVEVEDLRPIIDVLVAHSERWDTVYLISESSVLDAFQGIKGRLPWLRKLALISSDSPKITSIDLFKIAPRLRFLNVCSRSSTGEMILPCEQLLAFYDGGGPSSGFSRDRVIPLLQSLLDLRIAEFSIDDLRRRWPAIRMDHLRTMHINFADLEDTDLNTASDSFLTSLTIPGVHHLRITNYPGNIIPTLTSLINRSDQCTFLQELAFSTFYLGECEPGELSSLLQLTPFLRRLSVPLPSIVDLSRLVIKPDIPCLLPYLEELLITVHEHFAGYEGVLSVLARSRCEISPFSSPSSPGTSSRSSCVTSLSAGTCQLLHFRIIFATTRACHSNHEALERYGRAEEELQVAQDRVHLSRDWTVIHNSLPSVFDYFGSSRPRLSVKIRRAFQTAQFFTIVENARVNNVQELYLSDIHHLMSHIVNLSSSDIPGDAVYHFRKRARALLDKWAPLLYNDLEHRRWAFQGAHSIVYTPRDNAIRTSRELGQVLRTMIYGDIFYPQKYSVTWHDMQAILQFAD